ncbi:MAG: transporter [Candidatus Omnitrophica bacterium]|nr:transporter [Candidatus Omnitrophota bacterium]
MKQISLIVCVFVCLVLFSSTSFAQTDTQGVSQEDYEEFVEDLQVWKFTSSITYETGDYGTSTRATTVYIPFTWTRYFEIGNVSGTLPFIYQKSGPGVTAFSGRPLRSSNRRGGTRDDQGLGDVLLKGSYYILKEDTQSLNADVIGQIKFPTADDERGLGSGEFDETVGLETSKNLDELWLVFGDLYYTFIGEPTGLRLNNELAFNLGVGYKLSEPTLISLAFEQRTALVDDQDYPRDLIVGLNHKIDEELSFNCSADVGLSDGSPDFGATAGIGYKF